LSSSYRCGLLGSGLNYMKTHFSLFWNFEKKVLEVHFGLFIIVDL